MQYRDDNSKHEHVSRKLEKITNETATLFNN